MKPMIASLERLTSHDTKTPPGMLRIVWLDSQDPIPDTADTGRHLMRMESNDNGGSESEETREQLAMEEMGIIFPERQSEGRMEEEGDKDGTEESDSPRLVSCK
jgi:hypothetical protein